MDIRINQLQIKSSLHISLAQEKKCLFYPLLNLLC